MTYDTKDPRILAAHEAGERTAKALIENRNGHTFSPRYIAMAVVQDALIAFFATAEQRVD